MSQKENNTEKREQKQWWYSGEGRVIQVTGYSCKPSNDYYWWCPKVGYSCAEDYALFATEIEALRKCQKELNEEIKAALKQREIVAARIAQITA